MFLLSSTITYRNAISNCDFKMFDKVHMREIVIISYNMAHLNNTTSGLDNCLILKIGGCRTVTYYQIQSVVLERIESAVRWQCVLIAMNPDNANSTSDNWHLWFLWHSQAYWPYYVVAVPIKVKILLILFPRSFKSLRLIQGTLNWYGWLGVIVSEIAAIVIFRHLLLPIAW